jgi:hypothetical protein
MRPGLLRSLAAVLLCVTLTGCETKVSQISAVCRPGDRVSAPTQWLYTSKVDPSVLQRMPRALDITLHYTDDAPRAVPPITTYFYREDGATLRVASTSTATLPAKGSFTYHVDTGGYDQALSATGRSRPDELAFFVAVDGRTFGGLLSPPTCGRWADGHLDIGTAIKLPDLKDRTPLNMAQAAWLEVVPLPPAVARIEASETAIYAFFKAPIPLTETKNETAVPEGPVPQEAQVGVTATTTLFTLTGMPPSDATTPTKPPPGGKS